MQTGNMSIGIKDPSIFNLPAYCKAEKKCTPAQYESSQIGLVAQSSTGSNSTSYSIRQRTSLDSNRNMTVIVQEISGATFDLDLVLYQDNTNVRAPCRNQRVMLLVQISLVFPPVRWLNTSLRQLRKPVGKNRCRIQLH